MTTDIDCFTMVEEFNVGCQCRHLAATATVNTAATVATIAAAEQAVEQEEKQGKQEKQEEEEEEYEDCKASTGKHQQHQQRHLHKHSNLELVVSDCLLHLWVPLLEHGEICRLLEASASLRDALDSPSLWQEVANAWRCVAPGLLEPRASLHSRHRQLHHQLHHGLHSDHRHRHHRPHQQTHHHHQHHGHRHDGQQNQSHQARVQWRKVCASHEYLRKAWRGKPAHFRLDMKEELRNQELDALDVLMVEFLAGDAAMVLGHTKGFISVWQLQRPPGPGPGAPGEAAAPTAAAAATAAATATATGGGEGAGKRPAAAGPSSPQSPGPTGPSRAPLARISGIFATTRRYDVQGLAVSPLPSVQPHVLMLGGTVWLAAAVGPSAYIWESAGSPDSGQLTASLSQWELKATLRHSKLFSASHHAVWSVHLTDGPVVGKEPLRRAATVGEDGVFRVWHFAGSAGMNGEMLWETAIGDARQAVVSLLGQDGSIAAVARGDRRSLQLFFAESGQVMANFDAVWPLTQRMGPSLPQSVCFDKSTHLAVFSSIDSYGDGAMQVMDLSQYVSLAAFGPPPPPASPAGTPGTGPQEPPTWNSLLPTSGGSSGSSSSSSGSGSGAGGGAGGGGFPPAVLAGLCRDLRMTAPIAAAGVWVAIVQDGISSVVLEVWEEHNQWDDPARRSEDAFFRGRLPQYLVNPRLLATGGRRLALLDPALLRTTGQMRLWEWRPLSQETKQGMDRDQQQQGGDLAGAVTSTWSVPSFRSRSSLGRSRSLSNMVFHCGSASAGERMLTICDHLGRMAEVLCCCFPVSIQKLRQCGHGRLLLRQRGEQQDDTHPSPPSPYPFSPSVTPAATTATATATTAATATSATTATTAPPPPPPPRAPRPLPRIEVTVLPSPGSD